MPTALDDEPDQKNIADEQFQGLVNRNWSSGEQKQLSDEADQGSADNGDSGGQPLGGDDLEAGEQDARQPAATRADKIEKGAAGVGNDQVGEGYSEEGGKKKVKGKFWNRRRAIGGGIIGVILGGTFGVFTVLQGPLQVIHFGQLIQRFHFSNNEDFSDSRAGRFFIYMATLDDPSRRNLGVVSNKFADRYKKFIADSGIRMDFTLESRNGKQVRRVQAFYIDSTKEGGQRVLESLRQKGVTPDPPDGDGVVRVSARGRGGTQLSQQIIDASIDGLDINNVSASVGKRLLRARAKVKFHPMTNRAYEEGQEKRDAYNRRIQKEDAEYDKTGTKPPDGRIRGTQDDPDGDGNIDNDTTGEAGEAQDLLDEARGAQDPGKLKELRLKYGSLIKGGGLAGAGVGLVCAARGLGDQAEAIEHQNVILPLIRLSMRIVATASQVMSGVMLPGQSFNINELGAVIDTLHNDEYGSWVEAKSLQAELGQKQTGPDINDEARPSQVGQKPQLFQILENPVLDGACGVNDAIGGLPIIKQFGQATDFAINAALRPFGWSTDKLMTSLASLFANGQLIFPAFGSLLGGYAMHGGRLAANDFAMSTGGRALSGTETVQLKRANQELRDAEFRNQSKFARWFNVLDSRSVAGMASLNMPQTPGQAVTSLFNAPGKALSFLSSPVNAQSEEEPYDYGYPEYGFSLDERDDERLEEPMENADLVEPILDKLNRRYGKCFSMTVSPSDGSLKTGQAVRMDEREKDPDCSNPGESFPDGTNELLRYRMYLADMVTAHTLACYEGVETSCQQLFSSGNSTGSQDGAVNPNIYVLGDSLTVGMRDQGQLKAKLESKGWRVIDIEANTGDTIQAAKARIAENESKLKAFGGTVIIALGTNHDPNNYDDFSQQIGELVAEFKRINSSIIIKWVNVYTKTSDYPGVNMAIEDRASGLQYSIINWYDEVTKNPGPYPFAGDGIHHTAEGYNAKATFVADQIGIPLSSSEGLMQPPNLGPEVGNGYYRMPDAPNGEYIFSPNTPPNERCGSKTLINTIYTVAVNWHKKYPTSRVRIGDLNAPAHASHKNGIDVDITTEDFSAADTSGDQNKSKELGRLFANTGVIKLIFYNDSAVESDFNNYVQEKGLSGNMQYWPNHEDHFHVRILDSYALPTTEVCPS